LVWLGLAKLDDAVFLAFETTKMSLSRPFVQNFYFRLVGLSLNVVCLLRHYISITKQWNLLLVVMLDLLALGAYFTAKQNYASRLFISSF
jgi:uncharacterized membrane protein